MSKVEKFTPNINEVYFIENHTLLNILSGTGSIQVDFENYVNWHEKFLFLERGQYIKFLSEDFLVRRIEFSDERRFYDPDVRVLFKHLVSLGYVDLVDCAECQAFLSESIIDENSADIIDISSKHWYWQNPFKANKEEYQIIFDVKDIIDSEFMNNLSSVDIVDLINERGYSAQSLVKQKIGITIKNLLGLKTLRESQKQIAFTNKSIQEISYDIGFKDDAYFNRVFKRKTGLTPKQFRTNFDFKNRDQFAQDIIELLRKYHPEERSLGFYANKMNLSIKALSKKVRLKMNASLGQLIRSEIINTAKLMLIDGESISTVSYRLGFKETSHFSQFFKLYTGISPTDFR